MFIKINSFVANLLASFISIPAKHHLDIPFYSQWESPALVDKILSRKISAKDDPKWKNSGAKSKEEYEYWSWNLCGTACLKMIIAYENKKIPKLFTLARDITRFGGYLPKNKKIIDGLFYKPFIQYLNEVHKRNAMIRNPLSLNRIKLELSKGNFPIVSVSQTIRDEQAPTPSNKTGHLVIITGYDDSTKNLFLNNPSGYYRKSQKNHRISYNDFLKFYSGRGIIVYGKKEN